MLRWRRPCDLCGHGMPPARVDFAPTSLPVPDVWPGGVAWRRGLEAALPVRAVCMGGGADEGADGGEPALDACDSWLVDAWFVASHALGCTVQEQETSCVLSCASAERVVIADT